jgi:hypothetical protein
MSFRSIDRTWLLVCGSENELPGTVENPDDSLIPAGFPNDAFFQSRLPPTIVAKVDWPTLKVLPTSFIKSGLQPVSADLLFNVEIGGHDALFQPWNPQLERGGRAQAGAAKRDTCAGAVVTAILLKSAGLGRRGRVKTPRGQSSEHAG